MKKTLLALFAIFVLSACSTTPVVEQAQATEMSTSMCPKQGAWEYDVDIDLHKEVYSKGLGNPQGGYWMSVFIRNCQAHVWEFQAWDEKEELLSMAKAVEYWQHPEKHFAVVRENGVYSGAREDLYLVIDGQSVNATDFSGEVVSEDALIWSIVKLDERLAQLYAIEALGLVPMTRFPTYKTQ